MTNDQNHIKHFTAEDIRRYWGGEMSPLEMHALEKASLEDPFLADALDGYAAVDKVDAGNDIDWLKQQFNQPARRKKVLPLYPQWLRIAAMFAIVAGLATMGYFIFSNQKNKTTDIAKVADTKKEIPAPTTSPSIADSSATIVQAQLADKKEVLHAAPSSGMQSLQPPLAQANLQLPVASADEAPAIAQQYKEGAKTDTISQFNYHANANSDVAKTLDGSVPGVAVIPQSNRSQQLHPDTNVASYKSTTNFLSGRITNKNNEAVQGAVVQVDGFASTSTVSDKNGYFNVAVQDTTRVKAVVSSIGYEQANIVLNSDKLNSIRLNENKAALNEVVVVGYGSAKKREASRTASRAVIDTLQPAPEGGWDDYEEYIDRNKHSFENAEGEVVILFEVNKKGKPDNITVEKSLTELADKEAVRLVKEGPNWQPADKSKKRRVRVKIKF